MPIAQIILIEGRTEQQKRDVIEKVSNALQAATGSPMESIRVVLNEVPNTDFGMGGVMAKDLGR